MACAMQVLAFINAYLLQHEHNSIAVYAVLTHSRCAGPGTRAALSWSPWSWPVVSALLNAPHTLP